MVPQNVLQAMIYQAAWLLNSSYASRLEDIRSGLIEQQIGTGHQQLAKASDMAGGTVGLCDRAARIMEFYRLRSGRML